MKQLRTILLGIALVAVATPAFALGPIDVKADLGVSSKDVWRGMTRSSDAVLNGGVNLNLFGFGLGFRGTMDTSDSRDHEWDVAESEYRLDFGLSVPLVTFGAGVIYYDYYYPGGDPTTEIYISARANILLSPKLAIYRDLDAHEGTYWEGSISHGLPLSPAADLDFTMGLGMGSEGYLNGYFGLFLADHRIEFDSAQMSDFYLRADLPWHAVPFLTITPSLTYSTLLGDVKDAAEDPLVNRESDAFYYGIHAYFSF